MNFLIVSVAEYDLPIFCSFTSATFFTFVLDLDDVNYIWPSSLHYRSLFSVCPTLNVAENRGLFSQK